MCLDDEEEGQGEVEGPAAFDLLVKQVSNSSHIDDIDNSNLKESLGKKHTLELPIPPKRLSTQATDTKKKKLKVFDPPSWPKPPQESEFCTEVVISSCRKGYIQMLWNNLLDKILQMPLERMSSLEQKANQIMEEMCSNNAMDLSSLQHRLKTFFANAAEYESANTTLSQKIPLESYDELLASTKQCLEDATALEIDQAAKVSSCKVKLEQISKEEAKLKEELDNLQKRLDHLDAEKKKSFVSLQKHQDELTQAGARVTELRVDVIKIENSTPLLAEESETLQKMKGLLETNRQELSEFKF